MADNLSIQQQINNLLNQRTKVLNAHNDILKDQLSLASALNDALGGSDPEKIIDRFTEVRKALDEVATASKRSGNLLGVSFQKAAESIVFAKKTATSFIGTLIKVIKMPAVLGAAFLAGVADLGVKAFNLVINAGKATLGLFKQLAASAFNIGKAIYAFPSQVMQGLLDMSDELAKAFLHIARAWEEVRAEFGDPTEGVNRSIHSLVSNMNMLSGSTASVTRLGLYSVFQDQAEAAAYATEVMKGLGASASLLGSEISSLGMDFVVFQKGMGLSAEEMKSFADRAISAGRPIKEVLSDVANMSLQLSEAFGYSGKLVSKDMGKMIKDVARFGNLSVKRLGEVAIRARSLGLEVESLGKVVDKFLTFDDAAESAAMLSQAFGINVDSMTLMKEAANGGMGAIDEIRRALFEAGKSAEQMNLVDLRLLAQRTGLSEEEAKLAFSMKNRGRSMEEIMKQTGKAEKKELSQAEAMSKLADATERLIRFYEMSGGLFDRFTQGFSDGVKQSAPFLKTMFSLRAVSETVRNAGFQIGKAFTTAFTPVNKIFKALQEIYDPKRYSAVMDGIVADVTAFFGYLSDPEKAGDAAEFLFTSLKNRFTELFDHDGTATLIEGFQDMFVSAALFVGGAIPFLARTFIDAISGVVNKISEFWESDAGKTIWESIKNMFIDIGKFLGELIPWLGVNFVKGFNKVSSLISEFWESDAAANMWKGIKNMFSNVGQFIAGLIPGLTDTFVDAISAVTDLISGSSKILTSTDDTAEGMAEGMTESFASRIGDSISAFVDPIVTAIKDMWTTGKIQKAITNLLNTMTTELNNWATALGGESEESKELSQKLSQALGNLFKTALNLVWVKALKPAIYWLAGEAWATIKDKFNTLILDPIKSLFSWETAKGIMANFVKGMGAGLGAAADNPVVTSIFGAIDLLMEKLEIKSPSRFAERMIGVNLGTGLTKGVESSLGGFSDTMLDNMNLPATTDAIALMKKNLATDIRAINKSLDSIPEIDLKAKMTPQGNGLGIDGDTLKIDAGPLNLNLHLTVSMEADQVARVLVDKAAMVRKEKI